MDDIGPQQGVNLLQNQGVFEDWPLKSAPDATEILHLIAECPDISEQVKNVIFASWPNTIRRESVSSSDADGLR